MENFLLGFLQCRYQVPFVNVHLTTAGSILTISCESRVIYDTARTPDPKIVVLEVGEERFT